LLPILRILLRVDQTIKHSEKLDCKYNKLAIILIKELINLKNREY